MGRGVLIYSFDATVDASQQDAFLAACAAWSTGTPVTCKPRTGEADYVTVRTHTGDKCGAVTSCSSVGRVQGGGEQFLSILNSHWSIPSVIQHELGHSFGLIHEQQRHDRDLYIFVRTENLDPAYYYDVAVLEYADPVSDYDYVSIMHYPNCGGAKDHSCNSTTRNLWTLEPKPCGIDTVGGSIISVLDRDGLRRAYAPAIFALVGLDRSAACGSLTYGTDVVRQSCGGSCAGVQATETFNKVEKLKKEDCGSFEPQGWGSGQCDAIKKTEMSLNTSSHSFSCGFASLGTLQVAEATCGCSVSSFAAKCTVGSKAAMAQRLEERTPGLGLLSGDQLKAASLAARTLFLLLSPVRLQQSPCQTLPRKVESPPTI